MKSKFNLDDYVKYVSLNSIQIGRVTEITKEGNIRACGELFNGEGHLRGGGRFNTSFIRVISEEEYNCYQKKFKADKIKKEIIYALQRADYPLETVEEIMNILDK